MAYNFIIIQFKYKLAAYFLSKCAKINLPLYLYIHLIVYLQFLQTNYVTVSFCIFTNTIILPHTLILCFLAAI